MRRTEATIRFAAPLQPMHRGDWIDDPLNQWLRVHAPGSSVTGGGTAMDAADNPLYSETDIAIVGDIDELWGRLAEMFEWAPRGSKLTTIGRPALPLGLGVLCIIRLAVPTPIDVLYEHVPGNEALMRLMVRLKESLEGDESGYIPTWWISRDGIAEITVIGPDRDLLVAAISAVIDDDPLGVGADVRVVDPPTIGV